jgi:hypothetical protein
MENEIDQYHGVGGSYVIDKVTGKRVPDKGAPAPAPEPSAPPSIPDNEE